MRSVVFSALIMLAVAVDSSSAHAQIDPSSALLLRSGSSATVRDGGIDSGRYTVRPRGEPVRREERTVIRRQETEPKAEVKSEAKAEVVVETTSVTTVESSQAPAAPPVAQSPAPIQVVREIPQVDARRTVMLELSVTPGYLYSEAKSEFQYRKYLVNAPIIGVNAHVWLSPNFGLHSGFLGTSNASVSDALDRSRNVRVSQQWFWAGLRARKFFGSTNLSPVLTFGLDYHETQFRAPGDSEMRAKLSSSGPMFSLEAEFPTSPTHAWTLGSNYAPKLRHKETSNATDFKSGEDPTANSYGVSVGSRFRFDRSNSMFWKLSYMVERDVYTGETSVVDPVTQQTLSGVSVTNSTTFFHLGYTWSD